MKRQWMRSIYLQAVLTCWQVLTVKTNKQTNRPPSMTYSLDQPIRHTCAWEVFSLSLFVWFKYHSIDYSGNVNHSIYADTLTAPHNPYP